MHLHREWAWPSLSRDLCSCLPLQPMFSLLPWDYLGSMEQKKIDKEEKEKKNGDFPYSLWTLGHLFLALQSGSVNFDWSYLLHCFSLSDFKLHLIQKGIHFYTRRENNCGLTDGQQYFEYWSYSISLSLFTFQGLQLVVPCILSQFHIYVQWVRESGLCLLSLTGRKYMLLPLYFFRQLNELCASIIFNILFTLYR